MRGLLLNLVAHLAEKDDCSDEVWELFLALGRARQLARAGLLEPERSRPGLELPPLPGADPPEFRFVARSAMPFRDEDWSDIPGEPLRRRQRILPPPRSVSDSARAEASSSRGPGSTQRNGDRDDPSTPPSGSSKR